MRTEPQKSKRKRSGQPKRRTRQAQTPVAILNYRAARAALLDRLADMELQQGFHHRAERLAHQAAEMREQAR